MLTPSDRGEEAPRGARDRDLDGEWLEVVPFVGEARERAAADVFSTLGLTTHLWRMDERSVGTESTQ